MTASNRRDFIGSGGRIGTFGRDAISSDAKRCDKPSPYGFPLYKKREGDRRSCPYQAQNTSPSPRKKKQPNPSLAVCLQIRRSHRPLGAMPRRSLVVKLKALPRRVGAFARAPKNDPCDKLLAEIEDSSKYGSVEELYRAMEKELKRERLWSFIPSGVPALLIGYGFGNYIYYLKSLAKEGTHLAKD